MENLSQNQNQLTERGAQIAMRVLDVVNRPQYTEELEDPRVKQDVSGMVLTIVGAGIVPTDNTIDRGIELFSRHSLSAEEVSKLVGNLSGLNDKELDLKMTAIHTAAEFFDRTVGLPEGLEKDSENFSVFRMAKIEEVVDVIELIQSERPNDEIDSEYMETLLESLKEDGTIDDEKASEEKAWHRMLSLTEDTVGPVLSRLNHEL